MAYFAAVAAFSIPATSEPCVGRAVVGLRATEFADGGVAACAPRLGERPRILHSHGHQDTGRVLSVSTIAARSRSAVAPTSSGSISCADCRLCGRCGVRASASRNVQVSRIHRARCPLRFISGKGRLGHFASARSPIADLIEDALVVG